MCFPLLPSSISCTVMVQGSAAYLICWVTFENNVAVNETRSFSLSVNNINNQQEKQSPLIHCEIILTLHHHNEKARGLSWPNLSDIPYPCPSPTLIPNQQMLWNSKALRKCLLITEPTNDHSVYNTRMVGTYWFYIQFKVNCFKDSCCWYRLDSFSHTWLWWCFCGLHLYRDTFLTSHCWICELYLFIPLHFKNWTSILTAYYG